MLIAAASSIHNFKLQLGEQRSDQRTCFVGFHADARPHAIGSEVLLEVSASPLVFEALLVEFARVGVNMSNLLEGDRHNL